MSKYVEAIESALNLLNGQVVMLDERVQASANLKELKGFVEQSLKPKTPVRKATSSKPIDVEAIQKATHVMNSLINNPKYKELRNNGFCEGMKFIIVSRPRVDAFIAFHPRSGRKAIIKTELLTEITRKDF